MKTCPVCALELEDTYLFCPDDGSSLTLHTGEDVEDTPIPNEPVDRPASEDETSGAVVLYCPTCAAEYPLTFSVCPVHGVELTKHKIPRLSRRDTSSRTASNVGGGEATASAPGFKPRVIKRSDQLTSLHLERPEIEHLRNVTVGLPESTVAKPAVALREPESEQEQDVDESSDGAAEFNYPETFNDPSGRGERRGFRVAAIATIIALAFLALAGLYTLISNLSRRPPSAQVRVASQSESSTQPAPFIPTPQEARDYKQEQNPAASANPDEQTDQNVESRNDQVQSKTNHQASEGSTRRSPRKELVATLPPSKAPVPATHPKPAERVSNSPALGLPRGNTAGFDARLLRVRGRKTDSGFRYDLTFNMQEKAGRSAQWQRVLITTRSASGRDHSEAVPFQHRLGATGALTFTISVELAGRSETDWQGRVVCTTLGWDNTGAPLQASFGTNVKPW